MTVSAVLDGLGVMFLALGTVLALTGALGLIRFPDLLSRMHAATKPQVLGVLCVLLGVGLRLQDPRGIGMLVLVGAFQLLTLPASAQLVGRAAQRTGQVPDEHYFVDDDGAVVDGSAGDVLGSEDPGGDHR